MDCHLQEAQNIKLTSFQELHCLTGLTYKINPQQTQRKDANAKVEYVKRFYDQVKVQIAKKNESYVKQAHKKMEDIHGE